ncbi:hypothetical protein Mapa_001722 [Marchantia paleacea]|nr:hypothetical protein Mapa_001722 [Marchantia paleacea]
MTLARSKHQKGKRVQTLVSRKKRMNPSRFDFLAKSDVYQRFVLKTDKQTRGGAFSKLQTELLTYSKLSGTNYEDEGLYPGLYLYAVSSNPLGHSAKYKQLLHNLEDFYKHEHILSSV